MARRDPVGIRLLTRNGHDWSPRYPLIVQAVNMLKLRSCLIDGEAVCCGETTEGRSSTCRRLQERERAYLRVTARWSVTIRTITSGTVTRIAHARR